MVVALALLVASLACGSASTTDEVSCDSEAVTEHRQQVEAATVKKSLHQNAQKRLKEDARWEDPEQHEGLKFATDSTAMLIEEQEEIIQKKQKILDRIDCDEDDQE